MNSAREQSASGDSAGITKELARGRFTDEMLAQMRPLVGTELRTDACVNNEYATRLAIMRFAEGIGDDNPLWTDPEYAAKTAHGTLIAPPSFIFACLASVQVGWRGLGGFHADTTLTFHRTIRVGDRIAARVFFDGFEGPSESNFGGRRIKDCVRQEYRNQNDELVATFICSRMRFERSEMQERAAKSVGDLVALAKARPGEIRYVSSGTGGFNHFGGELFNMLAGVKLVHIPYKGGAPSMLDVMTGQVEVVFSTLIQALPYIRSGRLKPLGVGSSKRTPALPNVATIADSVRGYDGSIWWGLLTPAGVPTAIIARLNGEVNKILRELEMVRRLSAEAAEPAVSEPETFGKLIADDLEKWARIAKQAGIRKE